MRTALPARRPDPARARPIDGQELTGARRVAVAEGRTEAGPKKWRSCACSGLRTISYRSRDTDALCPDCRAGEVVRRETYWDWWLERFSAAECAAMARAIWGVAGRTPGRHEIA